MKVRTKPIPKKSLHNDSETITSSHTHRRFLGVQHACLEKPLMILLQSGNTQEILDWTLLRLITVTFQQRSVCSTRSWKFNVLVSHRSGAVAAFEGPKDVTEHMVRFVCDTLETWSFGVCVCLQVSKRAGRDRSAACCCQDKAIQDESEKHAEVVAWQFGSL